MTYKLPNRKHYVHKAIEPSKLSAKVAAELASCNLATVTQLKYDGCNCFFVLKDGVAYGFSRTGEEVKSIPHIGEVLLTLGLGNYVVFGEAYNFNWDHSTINGAFRRQSPQDELGFVMFDGVPLEDFEVGACEIPYSTRFRHLVDAYYTAHPGDEAVHQLFFATGCRNKADLIPVIEHSRSYQLLALDGFIVRKADGGWFAGAGTEGLVLKDKNHLSLDLLCVGITEGKGKFVGHVGSIDVMYGGKRLTVGGGTLSTEERLELFKNPERIIGHVVEVHALAGSSKGKLREPRYHRLRNDKTADQVDTK